jgi:hypothetical protein
MATMSFPATEEYILLIEFVHKHLDFHNAELFSILEMQGVQIGTDCQIRALPRSSEFRRPFVILSFPWSSIGCKFSLDDRDENAKRTKCINLISAFSRCTLIRSVLELWG